MFEKFTVTHLEYQTVSDQNQANIQAKDMEMY